MHIICRVPLFIFAILLNAEFARAASTQSPRIAAKRYDCQWIPATADQCPVGEDNQDFADQLPPCNYGQSPNTYCEADKGHDINVEIQNWDINNCNGRYDVYLYQCKNNNGPNVDNAQFIPNVEMPLCGYDLKDGYPLAAVDDGWRAQIFAVEYIAQNIMTKGDGTFRTPDGVKVYDCQKSCDYSKSYEEVYGEKSLQKSLKIGASVSAAIPAATSPTPGVGGSGSLSMGYNKVHNQYSQEHTISTISTATCCAYRYRIQSAQSSPNFHKEFLDQVKNLPDVYDKDAYEYFVKIFGTSYSVDTRMGAQIIQTNDYEQSYWSKAMMKDWNVQGNASVAMPEGTITAGFGIAGSRDLQENQYNLKAEMNIISKGGMSLGDNEQIDLMQWAKQVPENPAPVMITLHPISDLLQRRLYGEKYPPRVAEKLDAKYKNLLRYYKEYCRDGTCTEAMPDESPYTLDPYEKKWSAKRSKSKSLVARKEGDPDYCKYEQGDYVVAVNAFEKRNRGIVDIEMVCQSGYKHRFTGYGDDMTEENPPHLGGLSGIKVYHQKSHWAGIGVVNFELEDANDRGDWVDRVNDKTRQLGAIRKRGYSKCGSNEIIVGMAVQTEVGQGIIDINLWCLYIGKECEGDECPCDGDYRVVDEDTGKSGKWYVAEGKAKCDGGIIGPDYLPNFDEDDYNKCFCRTKAGIKEAMKQAPSEMHKNVDEEATEAASALGFISPDSLLVKIFAILGGTSTLFWLGQYMLTKPVYRNIGEQDEV